MARLTAAHRNLLSRQWLDIWNSAGRPIIQADATRQAGGIRRYDAIAFGNGDITIGHAGKYAQQTYGRASQLHVIIGWENFTTLVCWLTGKRVTKDERVNVRSGGGVRNDLLHFAATMAEMHIAAAVNCLDPTALEGFTSPAARQARAYIEEMLLRMEVSSRESKAEQATAIRL